jgi:PAS domain S-box-containing protein
MAWPHHERSNGEAGVVASVPNERVLDARALAFLAEASAVLGSSLDYEATLARVAQLAVPELADWCVVDLAAEGGGVRRVAVVCADHANTEAARRLRDEYPLHPIQSEGTPKVLRTGKPELIEEVSDEWVSAIASDLQQLELLQALQLRSNLIVPLIARARTIGALTLATAESGRTYGPSDVALAEELAARAAMAVDNARLFRDAEESLAVLDTLLASAPVGLAFWDRDLRYVRINDTLAALNGPLPDDHIGRTVPEVLPGLVEVVGHLQHVLESGEPRLNQEVIGETPAAPGVQRHWLASYYPVRAPSGETIGVGGVVSEITERRRSEQRTAAQHAVTRILAESPSLEDAAPKILEAVGASLEWELGAMWTVTEDGEQIQCSSVWLAPGVEPGRFESLSRRLAFPSGVGLPGRVWSSGRAAWIADVSQDPNFPRGDAAVEIGLNTAFAFPIALAGTVLGVVEFFTRRPQQPDAELLAAMELLGGQIGHFVERKEADQERIRLLAREHVARAEAEAARSRFAFLAEVSERLVSSLDYEDGLQEVARLAVPYVADWCAIDLVEDGALRRLTMVQTDPERAAWARDVEMTYREAAAGGAGPRAVIQTGDPQLLTELGDTAAAELPAAAEHLRALRALGLRSYLCVPMTARGRTLGALTFATAESGRRYGEADLGLAVELARRAATAVDNARLYRQAQERAQAARVLTHVGDGVFLLDGDGIIRLWNPAAEAITGLSHTDVVGTPASEAIPGWEELATEAPVVRSPGPGGKAANVRMVLPDRELRLSISGVGFEDGTVYAFRDLTEEWALEKMKSDFVSTISHELRTPLTAIYGSGLTLRRPDLMLTQERRDQLLEVIVDEAGRLARIVEDVLWASRLDSGVVPFEIRECDPLEVARSVVESQRIVHPKTELTVTPASRARIVADPDKLRQVLRNLVENAVKYSPSGGRVEVGLESDDERFRFRVADDGIGIPPSERERIFEKFYRLDPQLTHGVGGTGLGLYICREFLRRMEGRVWVEGRDVSGSVFVVELPVSGAPAGAY